MKVWIACKLLLESESGNYKVKVWISCHLLLESESVKCRQFWLESEKVRECPRFPATFVMKVKVSFFETEAESSNQILSGQLTWSSQTQACIFRYESLPFSVNLSQDFGFDNSSDTVPWLRPSTYLVVISSSTLSTYFWSNISCFQS